MRWREAQRRRGVERSESSVSDESGSVQVLFSPAAEDGGSLVSKGADSIFVLFWLVMAPKLTFVLDAAAHMCSALLESKYCTSMQTRLT